MIRIMMFCYKSGNDDESDNNENKVCLLLKDDVGRSCIRSCARSHDAEFCDYSVTVTRLIIM